MNVLVYNYDKKNFILAKNEEIPQAADCSICLKGYKDGRVAVKTTCPSAHLFHADCLSNWLNITLEDRKVSSCPICKNEIDFLRNPLKEYNSTLNDKITAAKANYEKGKLELEQAKTCPPAWCDNHLDKAKQCLTFAHQNGIPEAGQYLAELESITHSRS